MVFTPCSHVEDNGLQVVVHIQGLILMKYGRSSSITWHAIKTWYISSLIMKTKHLFLCKHHHRHHRPGPAAKKFFTPNTV